MEHKVIGNCPICGNKLKVSKLKCDNCKSEISGEFTLSVFDTLTEAEENFILVFLKEAGNIKQIEKDLNISYPTVKKMLEGILTKLHLKSNVELKEPLTKESILKDLKNDKISFEEAEVLLKKLEDKND